MTPTDIDARIAINNLNKEYGNNWDFKVIKRSKDEITGQIKIINKEYNTTVDTLQSISNGHNPISKCFLQCYSKIKQESGGEANE